MAMEGFIARWYDKSTGKNLDRIHAMAQRVTANAPAGSRILEVAPGPGYLSIELAQTGRYEVTGMDISKTFVEIATAHAKAAVAPVTFREGEAAHMPFEDNTFDFIVCSAAFKNFTEPLRAINEMHRVLTPDGTALILDLRRDASREAVDKEVDRMELNTINTWFTKLTFRAMLLKNAYSRADMERFAAESAFGTGEVKLDGIGFEIWLRKKSQ
jgi:ubiquinone/menaquinone biosynthesis C-methylase UbiE